MTLGPIRIVVSGPVGSGKSTLARALAERLGASFIAEDMLPLYKARQAFIQAVRPPIAPIEMQVSLRDAWLQSYFDWCDRREAEYAAAKAGFVADRWELDILGNWLRLFSANRPAPQEILDQKGRDLLGRMQRRSQHIDLAVLLPVSEGISDIQNEAGLARAADFASQVLSFHSSLGLLQTLPLDVLRYSPNRVEPLDTRIDDILALVNRLRR